MKRVSIIFLCLITVLLQSKAFASCEIRYTGPPGDKTMQVVCWSSGGGSAASVGFSVNINAGTVTPNVGITYADITAVINENDDDLEQSCVRKVNSDATKCVNGSEVRAANVPEVISCYNALNAAHGVSISPGKSPISLNPGPFFEEFLECDDDFRLHVAVEKNICEDNRYADVETCIELF